MNVPPVNIVVSFDPMEMFAFQKSESFSTFRKGVDQRNFKTLFFDNTSNSNFLSLSHSFSDAKGVRLELEILDPKGIFEQALLNNSVESWLPAADDPVWEQSLRKRDDALNADFTAVKDFETKRGPVSPDRTHHIPPRHRYTKLYTKIAFLDDKLKNIKKAKESLDKISNPLSKFSKHKKKYREGIGTDTHLMRSPLYVAYGTGDNLSDWSPPQCYGKIIGLEYSFNGSGVRILKLILVGLGSHPNLVEGSISLLGKSFTTGLITQGTSLPIFNEELAQRQKQTWQRILRTQKDRFGSSTFDPPSVSEDEIDKLFSDSMRPSLHIAITKALTDFIKTGINENENVYVLLPDLDKALKPSIEKAIKEVEMAVSSKISPDYQVRGTTLQRDDIIYFLAVTNLLRELGFSLCEDSPTLQPIGPGATRNLEHIWADYEYSIGPKKEGLKKGPGPGWAAWEWFQERKFKVAVQCNYEHSTFLEKLELISAKLDKVINSNSRQSNISVIMMTNPQAETDMVILQTMKKAGISHRADKPLIYWGDYNVIYDYLFARSYEMREEGEGGWDKFIKGLNYNINPVDRLGGLDYTYMKILMDYIIPIPWLGPFGPNNSGDANTIGEDTNTQPERYANLKKDQPLKASRMPVFTFGGKNPNILNIDIDINGIYTAAMLMSYSRGPSNTQGTSALIQQGQKVKEDQVDEILIDLLVKAGGHDTTWFEDAIVRSPASLRSMDEYITFYQEMEPPDEFIKKITHYILFYTGKHIHPTDSTKYYWQQGEETAKIIYEEDAEGGYDLVDDHQHTIRDSFIKYLWMHFVNSFFKKHLSKRTVRGAEQADAEISNSIAMQKKLIREVMVGDITTVPLFHLSTTRRALFRPCRVICTEPSITFTNLDEERKRFTWFSGLYEIVGFTHTISSRGANSNFTIIKGAYSSLLNKRKREMITGELLRG